MAFLSAVGLIFILGGIANIRHAKTRTEYDEYLESIRPKCPCGHIS